MQDSHNRWSRLTIVKLVLLMSLALSMSSMMSGFLIARRMGYFLMKQVMVLMFGMLVSVAGVVVGFFFQPNPPALFDMLHLIIGIHFVLSLIGLLMELWQVLPILLKTMQGAPIHSSHITNLLLTTFLSLGLFVTYVDLATMLV